MSAGVLFRFIRSIAELRRQEKLAGENLAVRQRDAFEVLRKYAISNSSFYRDFYRNHEQSPLGELPILTKSILMQNFDDLVTDRNIRLSDVRAHISENSPERLFMNEYEISVTSGTTGMPGIFIFNKKEWGIMLASLNRSFLWSRRSVLSLRRPLVVSIASMSPWHLSSRYNDSARNPFIPVMRIPANVPLEEMAALLNQKQPLFIVVYPSTGRILVREQIAGRLRIRPRAVYTGGEVLTDETRQLMEKTWNTEVFNFYGATETGGIATELFPCRNMHFFEDLLIVENLDENNRPVTEGELGAKLVVTNLFNFTQPLIRYEISDRVRISRDPCPGCGLSFARLTEIQGRREDVLSLPGIRGGSVSVQPALFDSVMDILPVSGWQVIQEKPDAVRILLSGVPPEFETNVLAEKVAQKLREEGAVAVVRVESVDAIPRSGSGKTPLIRALI